MDATASGELAGRTLAWDPRAAVCVVLAAEGYPGNYERGKVDPRARGAARLARRRWSSTPARARRDGAVVTDGGRVLGVTALGDDVAAAVARGLSRRSARIEWDGMHYRRDIGRRALERETR